MHQIIICVKLTVNQETKRLENLIIHIHLVFKNKTIKTTKLLASSKHAKGQKLAVLKHLYIAYSE